MNRDIPQPFPHPARRKVPWLVTALVVLLASCTSMAPGPRIVSFDAIPASDSPSTFRLVWEVADLGGGTLWLEPGPDGEARGALSRWTTGGVGAVTVSPDASTEYVLYAESSSGTSSATAFVEVDAGQGEGPRIPRFTASPDAGEVGTAFELSWEVVGLDGGTLTLSPGPNGEEAVSAAAWTTEGVGSVEVQPDRSTEYVLRAEADGASAEARTFVSVSTGNGEAPRLSEVETELGEVNPGVTVTARWTVEDATWVRLYGPGLPTAGLDVTDQDEVAFEAEAGPSYRLEAGNAAGSVDRDVPLTVRDAPAFSFLIAGQSNAQGRNLDAEDALDYIEARGDVRMFGNDYVWKHAYEPLDDCTDQVDAVSLDTDGNENNDLECDGMGNSGVSLGVSLGNALNERTGSPVFLVPAARGATDTEDWEPASDRYDRRTLFGSAAHRGRLTGVERGAPLGYARDGDRYGAVVWYQGESDSHSVTEAEGFEARTEGILDAFEAELDAPIVVAQLARRDDAPLRNEYYQLLRDAQRRVTDASDRFLVVTHDLPLADAKHLSADAQRELGRRVALAVREHLLGEDVDGTGPRVEDVDASSNGTTIDIHFDRAVTAPDSPGADAYGGYFSVFDDDGAVPIAEVARDAEDRIRITLQRPAAGTPSVRYMPPPVALAEIETNVVRAAACEERGPGDTCLPLPAFGVTPSTSLSDLRFPETHDE